MEARVARRDVSPAAFQRDSDAPTAVPAAPINPRVRPSIWPHRPDTGCPPHERFNSGARYSYTTLAALLIFAAAISDWDTRFRPQLARQLGGYVTTIATGNRAAMLGLVLLCAALCQGAAAQHYNAIYSFGDSISDAGNLCVGGCPSWLTTGQSPYGETFFHRPTGRCSDGRIIVDFLAEHFGLPLPPASKAGGDFKKGANMAIIGATTMNFDFFQSIGLSDKIWNNGPLDTQIQWFQQIMPSVCGKDCKNYLSKSLFVVGEFGGNDYNAALFSGRTMAEVRGYVPRVVSKLIRGVETIIRTGAVDVVVPGVLPIGCFPIYLTLYGTSNGADYDGDGCLKSYNGLSSYHNSLLKRSLANLQRTYPHARIMYADFYSQVIDMIRAPQNFGLKYGLKVCCGAGGQGKYNYNNTARCGMAGSSACADPGNYLIWDGIHLTEAAYRSIADGWLKGPYCNPPIQH